MSFTKAWYHPLWRFFRLALSETDRCLAPPGTTRGPGCAPHPIDVGQAQKEKDELVGVTGGCGLKKKKADRPAVTPLPATAKYEGPSGLTAYR